MDFNSIKSKVEGKDYSSIWTKVDVPTLWNHLLKNSDILFPLLIDNEIKQIVMSQ